MKIRDSVAFVTGAKRGLGLAFAKELLGRGVKKLYAGVRNPDGVDLPGVIPVKFDVTDPAAIAAAAARCNDVGLLINNAGIGRVDASALDPAVIDNAREIFETNFYGDHSGKPGIHAGAVGKLRRGDHQRIIRCHLVCTANANRLCGHEIRCVELHQRIAY